MFHGARILVAPLDWGLGHSTRDVPVIRRLLELDARPVIGADKGPLALLRDEFPQLPWVRIPGVNVRYSKSRTQLWSMARQLPAMIHSVRAEHALFDRLRAELQFDAVISDQRFGIRAADLPSVVITHQVLPFTPFAQAALRKLNRSNLARFHRCWIMDEPEAPGLAGELSHGRGLPSNARYIGTISRLQPPKQVLGSTFRIVAVISGPEPQRTLLEHILLDQLQRTEGSHLLVLGQPGQGAERTVKNVRVVPHMAGKALANALTSAELIVSRSGYTTLMDLVAIGRTALIVPTPGQQEQEYLGELHQRTGRFTVQQQEAVDLAAALRTRPATFDHRPPTRNPLLEQALQDLASLIRP